MSTKKDQPKREKPASLKPKHAPTKTRKSPRGLKMGKVVNKLLKEVDLPHKRHRNDYQHRMAQVAKLARML